VPLFSNSNSDTGGGGVWGPRMDNTAHLIECKCTYPARNGELQTCEHSGDMAVLNRKSFNQAPRHEDVLGS
jgi:hypothetical protein